MDLGLSDKIVLISGSSRGIGKAIARCFLQEDAKVLISGRNKETLDFTLKEFVAEFSADQVAAFCGDLSASGGIQDYLKLAVSKWSRVDIAVANIGSGKGVPYEICDEAEWQRVFQANLFSAMSFLQEVVPLMKRHKSGAVCLVASIAGVEAIRAPIPYSVAKAGIIAAGKSLSRHLAAFNIRVNVVSPGNIVFPEGNWETRIRANPEEVRSYIDAEVPLKRLGSPEEIANCVVFMCSPPASFVTGACLVVDGGQTRSF